MAESTTARLGLPRWSAQTDTPNRSEFDGAMASLETNAAMFAQGTLAARPAAGKAGRTYSVVGDSTAINNGLQYYDTGTTWVLVGRVSIDNDVRPSAANAVAQIIRGLASQTARLSEWRNSADQVLAYVESTGRGVFTGLRSLGTLAVDGITTLTGRLDANGGISTTTVQASGDVTAQRVKSTANRADGTPRNYLDADGSARVDGLIPPGAAIAWFAPTAPSGWLLCDGSAVSRTTYAALFAAIGTSHGGGDGSTTFNLPDARDRSLLGAGPARALGYNDGLAVGDRAARLAHTVAVSGNVGSGGAHTHTINGQEQGLQRQYQNGGGNYSPAEVNWTNHNHGGTTGTAGDHSHGFTGGGSAPEHPTLAVTVIIKF